MADRLTEILDRVAALPPGPWTAAADLGGTVWVIDGEGNTVDGQLFLDFITAARTDVPWLLTEIDRLRRQVYVNALLSNQADDDEEAADHG